MTSKSGTGFPQVVKLDKALKLAEQWVNSMSRSTIEQSIDEDFEGRPPRLGLGAKTRKPTEVADPKDHVERRLLRKLGVRSRAQFSKNQEELDPSKIDGVSDESDDEPVSRANAFAKRRPTFSPATQSNKKQR